MSARSLAVAVRPEPDVDPEGSVSLDDAGPMRRIASGDLSALGILYDRYHQDVRRFVARATRSDPDVEDIVQDTFLAVARTAPEYDGRPSARPFVLSLAARLVRQRRERFGRWMHALAGFGARVRETFAATPEKRAGDVEDLTAARAAIDRLSPAKRLVLLLAEDGLSGDEIARALDIPTATVWSRLHYARAEIRDAIEKGQRR